MCSLCWRSILLGRDTSLRVYAYAPRVRAKQGEPDYDFYHDAVVTETDVLEPEVTWAQIAGVWADTRPLCGSLQDNVVHSMANIPAQNCHHCPFLCVPLWPGHEWRLA